MQEQDPFYKELPFTLQDQQLQPEYVIFGTGLQESAIAAYLSKMEQKKGLILDLQKTYGSCLKTVTIKQLHQLVQKKTIQRLYDFIIPQKYKQLDTQFYDQVIEKKAFRGYNIDIQPCLFFGNSITCESLKQADMDKYMDFRLVSHMLKYQKGKLEQVPLSKGKIFQSKVLSLLQKKLLLTSLHTLIKLFHRHMNIEEDQNSTKQFDKGFGKVSQELYNEFKSNEESYFLPFLQKLSKKNKKIMDFMAYIICNYQYNYSKPIPQHAKDSYKLKSFIEKFGKFIMSCGIYGQGPYLYVDNGIGDIPQAFSRISSIFGSTYILHPRIEINSIEQRSQSSQSRQSSQNKQNCQKQQNDQNCENGQNKSDNQNKQNDQIKQNSQKFLNGQIKSNSQNKKYIVIKSNIAPNKEIKTKHVYFGETFTQMYLNFNIEQKGKVKEPLEPSNQVQQLEQLKQSNNQSKFNNLIESLQNQNSISCEQTTLRIIILCKRLKIQEQCPSIGYFFDIQSFDNPVYLFMFDDSTHTCPSQYVLYQFSSVVQLPQNQSQRKEDISHKIQILLQKLTEIRGQKFRENIVYLASYIRKNNFINHLSKPSQQKSQKTDSSQTSNQTCLQGCFGLDLDIHFQNFIKVVGKKDNYFRKKNPYQEDQQNQYQEQRNNILQKLENINLKETEQSSQLTKSQNVNEPLKQDLDLQQEKADQQIKEVRNEQKNDEQIEIENKIEQCSTDKQNEKI